MQKLILKRLYVQYNYQIKKQSFKNKKPVQHFSDITIVVHLECIYKLRYTQPSNLLKKKTCALKNERLQPAGYLLPSKAYTRLVLTLYVSTKKIGQETYFFCCKKAPL